ncbi:MAG: Gfo/Idh/MocA family oxidoreductase [Propionibacteriaceae bacterium]|jgi:predicted dehydrogenase|nr:Gfo/Idh/MocA family oxidoreductase [Propionibacteriaceae bacterium]
MAISDPMTAPGLRWGVLAPGGIAHRFAHEIPKFTRSQIVAVGSRDLGRAQKFVETTQIGGGVRPYGSYEGLVADPGVEAVYIASPHSEHYAHARLALEAGKHILVEKSFTLNAAQAQTIFMMAAQRRLFVMEAMWSRFLPHYQVLREIVASGEIGQVNSIVGVHAQSLNMDPHWRLMNPALGGGALLDLGVYPLSLIHWLWGLPQRIKVTGALTSTGVDLRESISMWYGDRLAVAYADMGAAGKNSLQIVGSNGRLEIPDWFYTPQNLVVTSGTGQQRVVATRVEGGFQYQVAEMARCLAAGMYESPIMSWAHTVEVMQLMDEVRRQLGVVYPIER